LLRESEREKTQATYATIIGLKMCSRVHCARGPMIGHHEPARTFCLHHQHFISGEQHRTTARRTFSRHYSHIQSRSGRRSFRSEIRPLGFFFFLVSQIVFRAFEFYVSTSNHQYNPTLSGKYPKSVVSSTAVIL